MRDRPLMALIVATAIVMSAVAVKADVPTLINYQGVLQDSEGNPVTEPVNVTFTIYDSPSDGTQIWQETQAVDFDDDGRFDVLLGIGEGTPITDDVFEDPVRWLGVQVEGDDELEPRTRIVSVAYAHRIGTVDGATGGIISGDVAIQSDLDVNGDIRVTGKATIGPGHTNTGNYAFVVGEDNTAGANYSSVGGGMLNVASGDVTTVGGGLQNTAGSGGGATVAGGGYNEASSPYSAVGGGAFNNATGEYSTVGGGETNTASADYATVGGGLQNTANFTYATVAGGVNNAATGEWSTVAGGVEDTASGSRSMVGGGVGNTASGPYSIVGGGYHNSATAGGSVVAGGVSDTASGTWSAVGGGQENTASGDWSTIGGGYSSVSSGDYSTVAGGMNNAASSEGSAVGGGNMCVASNEYSVVAGGNTNTASGWHSSIGGGAVNEATGFFSCVPGGQVNAAGGDYSFAAGRKARANHNGAFVWGDHTDDFFSSTGEDQFLIRASGGVGIGTPSPDYKLDVEGTVGIDVGSNFNDVPLTIDVPANQAGLISRIAKGGSIINVVDNNGNVGIGTFSPQGALDVSS
ncbi:MAG: hypothetical protein ACYS21_14710, partial [Planctomycetota bacterium]